MPYWLAHNLTALFQFVLIGVTLAGDNAIVVALAVAPAGVGEDPGRGHAAHHRGGYFHASRQHRGDRRGSAAATGYWRRGFYFRWF